MYFGQFRGILRYISSATFSYLLGFGWTEGDGNISFVWASSNIFAWAPMSSLLARAVSIFVAVSLLQWASLSLTEGIYV